MTRSLEDGGEGRREKDKMLQRTLFSKKATSSSIEFDCYVGKSTYTFSYIITYEDREWTTYLWDTHQTYQRVLQKVANAKNAITSGQKKAFLFHFIPQRQAEG